jgi:hypothetical protein
MVAALRRKLMSGFRALGDVLDRSEVVGHV